MGFRTTELGPEDQKLFKKLEPKIITTLRKAASHASRLSDECRVAKVRWFGNQSTSARTEDAWMKNELSKNLNALASVLNTNTFTVKGLEYRSRDKAMDYYGWALMPRGGFQQYTNMTQATNIAEDGRNFTIALDNGWRATLPTNYPSSTKQGMSKFHAVVHELTHLILGTDDINPPYGPVNCTNKAKFTPASARNNADNWAFFVDQMFHARPIVRTTTATGLLPTYDKWMQDTKLGRLYSRGRKLGKVDDALQNIQRRGEQPQFRTSLKRDFNAWYKSNPKDRKRRNKNGIVEKLRIYIEQRY